MSSATKQVLPHRLILGAGLRRLGASHGLCGPLCRRGDGQPNPITPKFVEALAGTLYERMDIEGRTEELSKAGEAISRAMLLRTSWLEK